MVLSVILVAMIISAIICHMIANRRRSNSVFWGAMGFSFGPLAIPFALLSKPVAKHPKTTLNS